MLPVVLPPESLKEKELLHYWALQFQMKDPDPEVVISGYAGFQSDGRHWDSGSVDSPVINFAIWEAQPARSDGIVVTGNEECRCDQIMMKFAFEEGVAYRFVLDTGPSGTTGAGRWWGLWVTNQDTEVTTFVGEIFTKYRQIDLTYWLPTSWAEDTHWWRSENNIEQYECEDFEPSSMAVLDVVAGRGVPFHTEVRTTAGNTITGSSGHVTGACDSVSIWVHLQDVQHNLGYWTEPPENVLANR